jgi:hypothetical protein
MDRKSQNTLQITVFCMYIFSLQPWFFDNIHKIVISLVGCGILILHRVTNKSAYFLSSNKLLLIVAFFFGVFSFAGGLNLNAVIFYIPIFVIFSIIISLKEKFKSELFLFIVKYFAIFQFISLTFYIVNLIGVSLPSSIIHCYGYPPLDNYYFFLKNTNMPYVRFQSVFVEPGHMIMGIVPLIIASRFDIRNKYVVVLILSVIFSLSLAGYLTLIIGILLILFRNINLKKLIIILPLFLALYHFTLVNSDTILYRAIGARIQFSDVKIIEGNNRTKSYFETSFKDVLDSNDKWFGVDRSIDKSFVEGSQGFKVYILNSGIIGFILIMFSFISFGIGKRNYTAWSLIFITLVLLMQNSYPYWYAVSFNIILGIPYVVYRKDNATFC